MERPILSVKQLNLYVRSLIEGDIHLSNVTVCGELSNFKNHYSSGHLYFTLKDNDAAIRCVMFRAYASRIKFLPEDGLKVVLKGRVSLYEKDGQYQFYAEEMSAAGIGDLSLQFEQIKAKLEKEGMFDASSKRALPKFPQNIAVITSPTGAAVQDIINILSRRWPATQIIMCPVSVQGELAVKEMLDTLERVYNLGMADIIIIGRGGGSAEDLSAFNNEELARKLYESPVPIISAVGHETDFTICDFVADMRAPTPSAAAELAVPDINEFISVLNKYTAHLKTALSGKYSYNKARLEKCSSYPFFKTPVDTIINSYSEAVDRLFDRLGSAIKMKLNTSELLLAKSAAALDGLSPLKTLSRGYAAVNKDGKAVSSVAVLQKGDSINVEFTDGIAYCEVKDITNSKE